MVNVIRLDDPLPKEAAAEMSFEEWESLGKKLYGDDKRQWKFKCPSCGHVQSPEDFRKYKEKGAFPSDAYYNCLGRYDPTSEGTIFKKGQPCNYTLGGLFKLSSRVVVDGDKRHAVFLFADEVTSDA
jgi:predicted RNA-binding Zn-ribbon protein involved in translation (DUF1610 family)